MILLLYALVMLLSCNGGIHLQAHKGDSNHEGFFICGGSKGAEMI